MFLACCWKIASERIRVDGARQRLLPVENMWVGVGAAAKGQAGHKGSRIGAGVNGGSEE